MQTCLLSRYWEVLQAACVDVCSKHTSFIKLLLKEVLRVWPKVDTNKEELFMGLLASIFEIVTRDVDVVNPALFGGLEECLCKRIASSIESQHYEVSEKALKLFDGHPQIFNVTFATPENVRNILPTVFRALFKTVRNHPFESIRYIAAALVQYLEKVNEPVARMCDRLWTEVTCAPLPRRPSLPEDQYSSMASDDGLTSNYNSPNTRQTKKLSSLTVLLSPKQMSPKRIPLKDTSSELSPAEVSSPARRSLRRASWSALELANATWSALELLDGKNDVEKQEQNVKDKEKTGEHARKKVSEGFIPGDNSKFLQTPGPQYIALRAKGPWEGAPDSPPKAPTRTHGWAFRALPDLFLPPPVIIEDGEDEESFPWPNSPP
jgi:hypothetical protein